MARLPTVVLRKPGGEVRKVNLTEYQANIAKWVQKGFKLVTVRRGDADDDAVRAALREWEINEHRLRDPGEQAWRKDHQRAFEERAIRRPVVTSDAASTKPETPVDEDWRSFPWFKARAWVKARTGTLPQNKDHAEQLMSGVT